MLQYCITVKFINCIITVAHLRTQSPLRRLQKNEMTFFQQVIFVISYWLLIAEPLAQFAAHSQCKMILGKIDGSFCLDFFLPSFLAGGYLLGWFIVTSLSKNWNGSRTCATYLWWSFCSVFSHSDSPSGQPP